MVKYAINILIAIDQLITAILGGWPDETLSSYAWRLEMQGKPGGVFRKLIDKIFFWDPNHCYNSWLAEKRRHQLPPELR